MEESVQKACSVPELTGETGLKREGGLRTARDKARKSKEQTKKGLALPEIRAALTGSVNGPRVLKNQKDFAGRPSERVHFIPPTTRTGGFSVF